MTEVGPSLALIMPRVSNCISKRIPFFFFFNSHVWRCNFAAIEIQCAISFLGLPALIVYPWLCASVPGGLEIHNFSPTP